VELDGFEWRGTIRDERFEMKEDDEREYGDYETRTLAVRRSTVSYRLDAPVQ
jgi:hypothetical protein